MVRAIELTGVGMSFDGVGVLRDVSMAVQAGEVHGLVGQNGSGKSTLVKILSGLLTPDAGSEIRLWERRAPLPVRPNDHGVAIIHQDLALAEHMSVADNIGVGCAFGTHFVAPVRAERENHIAKALLDEFALDLSPTTRVSRLSPAEQSVVAILRSLRQLRSSAGDQHILVLDEPTAALPRSESTKLLKIVRSLARSGVAVVLISHRLSEILQTCDRISVLRSGELVANLDAASTDESEVVHHMLGYELGDFYPPRTDPPVSAPVSLDVQQLTGKVVESVSFQVRQGEILGVTGLVGMGQDEIPYLVCGATPRRTGTVEVGGRPVGRHPSSARKRGIALVPGKRQRDGIWMGGDAMENLTLPFLGRFTRFGTLLRRRERVFARTEMERFAVRPPRPGHSLSGFSGGNQQKIVLARCLHTEPKVLLLHEPTQGVDAGAKKDILKKVTEVARQGTAVVLFSSDCEEVAETATRVLVMGYGRVSAEIESRSLSESVLVSEVQAAGRTSRTELVS